MSTNTPWIAQQADALRLSSEIVSQIREAGYEEQDDFAHVTQDALMGDVAKAGGDLKRPAAIRILKAAGALTETAPTTAPAAIKVSLDKLGAKQQIVEALGDLVGPGRAAAMVALRSLGIFRVVIDDRGTPVVDATLEYVADGSPAVAWWADRQVVALDGVGAKRPHHPRTGQPISKADPVPWHELDRDSLAIAAAIYAEGLDAGDGERVVFGYVKSKGDVAQQAARRLAASPELRRRAEARIDGSTHSTDDSRDIHASRPVSPMRGGQPAADSAPAGVPRAKAHTDMLLRMFSASELRRLVSYFDESLSGSLPGTNVSASELAHSVADLIERRGYTHGADWWRRLVSERSNRAAEIRAVASMYGVNP